MYPGGKGPGPGLNQKWWMSCFTFPGGKGPGLNGGLVVLRVQEVKDQGQG